MEVPHITILSIDTTRLEIIIEKCTVASANRSR
jgi:hypothetical protein